MSLEVLAEGFSFAEAPIWNSHDSHFYFVDIDEGELWRIRPELGSKPEKVYHVDDWVSGVVFDDNGNILIASRNKKRILQLEKQSDGSYSESLYVDLSEYAGNNIRHILRTPSGYIYVGADRYDAISGFEDATIERTRGPLLVVDPDRNVSVASSSTNFPNMMVLHADRLYMVDTYDECIYSWNMQPDGKLTDEKKWATFENRMPDGMCLDIDHGIWVTSIADGQVFRIKADGTITDTLDVPGKAVTACALGGDDGRQLIVSATKTINRSEIEGMRTSVLLLATVAYPGVGLPSVYA